MRCGRGPMSGLSTADSSAPGYSPLGANADPHSALPDLNGVDLAMSLSPKTANASALTLTHHSLSNLTNHNLNNLALGHQNLSLSSHLQHLQHQNAIHNTPFSVTDILSPIEESYRKLDLQHANPPSPYRSTSSGSSINSPIGAGGSGPANMAANVNPYAMAPLYHSPGVQGGVYCGGGGELAHYTDMRGSAAAAGWYGATANDPRFAISRLMGSSTAASMNHAMNNMSGLAACSVTGDAKPMQFPLAQRRKRRVLFTQAQILVVTAFSLFMDTYPHVSYSKSLPVLIMTPGVLVGYTVTLGGIILGMLARSPVDIVLDVFWSTAGAVLMTTCATYLYQYWTALNDDEDQYFGLVCVILIYILAIVFVYDAIVMIIIAFSPKCNSGETVVNRADIF